MSSTRLIPFTISFRLASPTTHWTPSEWHATARNKPWLRGRCDGKPTPENIAKYVAQMESSMLPGGPNDHLANGATGADKIMRAWVTDQRSGEVLATWDRDQAAP